MSRTNFLSLGAIFWAIIFLLWIGVFIFGDHSSPTAPEDCSPSYEGAGQWSCR
jgi:hypothetical protein